MRTLIIITTTILLLSCNNNSKEETIVKIDTHETDELIFDSIKAQQYGADEYGMKQYVIAFLKKGPNRDLDSAEAVDLSLGSVGDVHFPRPSANV